MTTNLPATENVFPPRTQTLFLALILLLAIGPRLLHLDHASLWLDEVMSVLRARPTPKAGAGDVIQAVAKHDAHPPLYYLLLHPFIQKDEHARSPFMIRLPSALVGILSVSIFFAIARIGLPPPWAFWATLLFASNAFQIYFSREARHYVLATFLILLAQFAFLMAMQKPRARGFWILYGLSITLAGYTFYYTLFLPFCHLLTCIQKPEWRSRLRPLISTWTSSAFLLLPWIGTVTLNRLELAKESAVGWSFPYHTWSLPEAFLQFFTSPTWEVQNHVGLQCMALALSLLLLSSAITALRLRPIFGVSTVLWAFLPLALIVLIPVQGHQFDSKHLAFTAPAHILLVCALLSKSPSRLFASFLFVTLLLLNVISSSELLSPSFEKEDWNRVAEYIYEEEKSSFAITTAPDYLLHPLGHALRRNIHLQDSRPETRIPLLLRPDDPRLSQRPQILVLATPFSPVAPLSPWIDELHSRLSASHRLVQRQEIPANRKEGFIHLFTWTKKP